MFAVTIAGEGESALQRISSALRGRRFRVETLVERRGNARRVPTDGMVLVSESGDRMQVTKIVLEARRDDDVRFVPFALVARTLERSAAHAFGAKTFVHLDVSADELAREVRRMLLREQEDSALVHQLEGEIGELRIVDVLETLERGRRDAVVRVSLGPSRGAIRVRRGVAIAAMFDAESGRPALDAMRALERGRFRVELRTVDDTDELGALDAESARAIVMEADRRAAPQQERRSALPRRGDGERAPDAALAAALVNAVAAHARTWISDGVIANEIERARLDLLSRHPALGSFRVLSSAIVLVENVDGAAAIGGAGIGDWIGRALDRLEHHRPGRFGRGRVGEVVGGLARLLDQVGWRADFDSATGVRP